MSPRGGARYPFAQTNAMRVLNDGDASSSADEVATEGEPTPRASARDAKVENALDVLLSDPIFDEDD